MTLSRGKRLERHTALSRGKPMERGEGLKRSGPMKRSRIRRRAPRRLKGERNDTPYRLFVCLLPCAASSFGECRGDIQPAHATLTLNEKGASLKVHDHNCIPLCAGHHDQLDGREQPRFTKGWSRERRFAWCARIVKQTQELATPQDRDQALSFQGIGLGRIVPEPGESWSWLPGPEVPAAEGAL